jgi:hypothetical protein
VQHSGGVMSIFFLALLLSNIRATWLAKNFAAERMLQQPYPLAAQAPSSVFTDTLPRLIWPVGRWLYYCLTVLMLGGLTVLLSRTPALG